MGNKLQSIINLFKRKQTSDTSLLQLSEYSKSYKLDGNFTTDFYNNLARTIAWTENIISKINDTANIDYVRILRSTNPIYEGKPFYSFDNTRYGLVSTPDIPFDYNKVLTDALAVRAHWTLPVENLNDRGKILKFEIDITTLDGAPCSLNGFVDESDIPPIDTWFHITTKYLSCWIPKIFISKMQDAIDVEILGSYSWLEESNSELNLQITEQLKSGG